MPVTRIDIAKDFKHYVAGIVGSTGTVEIVGYFKCSLPAGATVNKITYFMKFKRVESWALGFMWTLQKECEEWTSIHQGLTLMRGLLSKWVIPTKHPHTTATVSAVEDFLKEPRTDITGGANNIQSILYKGFWDTTAYQTTVDIWVEIDWSGTGEPVTETRYTYGVAKEEAPAPSPTLEELGWGALYGVLAIGIVLVIVYLAVQFVEVG